MTKQVYYSGRNTYPVDGVYETVKKELLGFFITNKALLDQKLDAAETYTFDSKGFKVLEGDAEPWRKIECQHLLIKDDVVVGLVILRVNNERPKHGVASMMDCMERVYELRFKTFSGCDFTVEGTGISITQRGVNGAFLYNSGSVSSFSEMLLERHWNEFKDQCTFTAAEVDKPMRSSKWSKALTTYARQ